MSDQSNQKKEMLHLERGGRYGQRPMRMLTTSEFRLDREMQAAFAAIYGEDGAVPSKGIYSIRAHEQRPWRVLARRILEARAKNAPREQIHGIIRVFALWVDELYSEHTHPNKAA